MRRVVIDGDAGRRSICPDVLADFIIPRSADGLATSRDRLLVGWRTQTLVRITADTVFTVDADACRGGGRIDSENRCIRRATALAGVVDRNMYRPRGGQQRIRNRS